jgi:hypothetical protein
MHLTKKSDSGTEFTLHSDFDQSFIPKLLNSIHKNITSQALCGWISDTNLMPQPET